MALWDLAGKAYGVPVYQMLGGKYRDKIRIYADTPSSKDPKVYATRMKGRIEKGFTFLKMDFGIVILNRKMIVIMKFRFIVIQVSLKNNLIKRGNK